MTILITGATGQVGGALVRSLAGRPGVRALVRDERAAAALGGVEVVIGSFDDERALTTAMDGVEFLFLAGRDDPQQVALHGDVLDVARAAGVRHVVKLSALGARPDSPVALMRWHHDVEERLRESEFAWTLLRPHLYMQNLLRFAGAVAEHGRIAAPMGARRYPLVDARDVGAAAAAVLRDPDRHAGRAYALTGPAALSYDEVAARLSAVVGHPVGYDAQPPEAFYAGLVAAGVPEWRADDLAAIARAYDDSDNVASGDAAALLGRPPTAIDAFFAEHRSTYVAGASRSHL
jgi:uncharacterized protein YbjT (DUF2867 family)